MKKTILFSVLLVTLLCTTAGAVVYRPGLIQAKISGNPANNTAATYTSNLVATVSAELLDRTAGTMMANYRADNNSPACVNPLSGLSWKWGQYTTYAYEGEIWLDAGIKYNMFEQGDDGAAIIIDGNIITTAGDSSRWQSGTGASWTPPETGWHRFNAYSWDWTGNKGPVAGCWGLAWNTNGTSQTSGTIPTNSTAWTSFTDPGDMSLLRMVSSESAHATVSNMVNIGGGYVDVTLAYTNLPTPVTVFAVVDSADQGPGYFSSWSQKVEVGTIPAGFGTIPFSIPFDVSKPYARLVLQCRDTLEVSFEDWLDVINLTNAETASGPTFTQTVTPIYTNAVFEFQVTSIKSAAPAQFSILVSPNSDYSDSVFNEPVGDTVSADGDTVTYNVTGLQPNTFYYAKVTLSGNDVTTEKAMTFLTGLPIAPELSVAYDPTTTELNKGKFGLNVTSLGATWADVYFDLSDTADFANCTTREIRLGATEPFSENVEEAIPSDRATYGRVRVVNDWDLSTTSETMFYAMGPIFTAEKDGAFLSPVFRAIFRNAGRIGTKVIKLTLSVYDNADLIGNPVFTQDYQQDIGTFPTTVQMLQARGFAASTTYYVRLTAVNDENWENFSDVIPFTTPAAGDNVWANTSSDIENPASYVYAWGKPASNKILHFETPPVFSPVINRDTVMPALSFGATNGIDTTINAGTNVVGYVIAGTGRLTFDAETPFICNTYGANTISNPILFNRGNDANLKLSFNNGEIVLAGPLSTPADGEVKVSVLGWWETLRIQGDTTGMKIKQITLGNTGKTVLEHQHAFTNAKKILFSDGWGALREIENNSGAPLSFDTTNVVYTTGWSCPGISLSGDPFIFDNVNWFNCPRGDNSANTADMRIRNLILKRHDGDARLIKRGTGVIAVTDTTTFEDRVKKTYIRVDGGCFFPMTDAAWDPDRMIFIQGGTIGLNEDYYPSLTATNSHKLLGILNTWSWGYTAFNGDKVVCYENDPSFVVTTATQGGPESRYTDTVTVSPYDPTKTLSSYNAWPQNFVFGNRSPWVNGTVLFKNPISITGNIDVQTYFESTNHHVAARLQGGIDMSIATRTWSFEGNGFGGYLALESVTTGFTAKVSIRNKGNLLVNGVFAKSSEISVKTESGLGGMGRVLAGSNGIKIEAGGALFGGEYGKGGCLTVDGKLSMESNSILRVEVPDTKDAPVGYVKLANTDSVKELKLTAPIKVMVDASLKSPSRRVVKVMDWSGAVYKDGAIPTREMFTPVYGEGTNVRSSRLYVEGDALYISYVLDNVPLGSTIIIR